MVRRGKSFQRSAISKAPGLRRAGFRPEGEVCALRALMRHRGDLVQMAASRVQHMHKSLTEMNLQIQHVISDLTGLTGLAMIDAILEGQHDPAQLAKLRDPRVKAPPEVIEKSLVGHWRPEHLFTLKQSRRLYAGYQQQIAECDTEIERQVGTFPFLYWRGIKRLVRVAALADAVAR